MARQQSPAPQNSLTWQRQHNTLKALLCLATAALIYGFLYLAFKR